jgi:hypothetical protein
MDGGVVLTGEYSWSLGVWVGLPFVAIVIIVFLLGAVFFARLDEGGMAVGTVAVLLVFLGVSGLLWYPFAPVRDFHAWNVVQGTVDRIDKRLISSGDKGMAERYVITFKESDEPFACDDTRCSLSTPGKRINLLCKKEFEFFSVPGWACRHNQSS